MDRLVWAALACTAIALAQPVETAADLAARYLPELIRLDTTNPPGNETRVARYLKQVAGPTGAFVPVLFSVVAVYGYSGLALATMMAGVMLILLGALRMGRLLKFFS